MVATDQLSPRLLGTLTNSVQSLKSAAGQICLANIYNPNASVAFVQLFDAATPGAVTLGTTAPKLSLAVPAGGVLSLAPSYSGVGFISGIQVAATTTYDGSTAPASALVANFGIR